MNYMEIKKRLVCWNRTSQNENQYIKSNKLKKTKFI